MTPERFDALVAAYGAAAHRWPEAERAQAQAFVLAHPDLAEPALAAGRSLDDILGAYAAPPSAGLAARILAARPAANDWRRWGAGLGAGLAAACAAGVVFGIQVSESAARDVRTEAVIAAGLGADPTTTTELVQEEEQG